MLAELEAPAPSPAGGSAAALACAAASSLVIMVGRGSPSWLDGAAVADAAAALRARLLALGDQDAEAIEAMLAAFRARGEEAPGRQAEALLHATEVPCEIARQASAVAGLAARAAREGKRVMSADAAVAALLAETAARAAALIVSVNAALLRRGAHTDRAAGLVEAAQAAGTAAARARSEAVAAAGA